MNPKSTRLILIGLFLLAAVAAAYFFLRSSPPADTADAQQEALAQLQQDSESEPRFHFYNGFPGFAQVSVSVQDNDPVERARNYLQKYQDLYLQDHADLSLEVLREDGDTVAFYQTYKGLRVYAAEIVVSLQGDTVFATVGNLLTSDVERQALNLAPSITDADAIDLARTDLDMPGAEVIGSPELVVFEPSFVSEAPGILHLAMTTVIGAATTWTWATKTISTGTIAMTATQHRATSIKSSPFITSMSIALAGIPTTVMTANWSCSSMPRWTMPRGAVIAS